MSENGTTKECPICLEEFHKNDQETILRCKHSFHSDCLVKCFLFQNKTRNYRRVSCPMCRRGICCNTKRVLLYDTYSRIRQDYKNAKKQSSQARCRLMKWNFKHQILKIFKKYTMQQAYDIIVRDEELTYEMHKTEAVTRQKRQEYYSMKALYERACCARCVAGYYQFHC